MSSSALLEKILNFAINNDVKHIIALEISRISRKISSFALFLEKTNDNGINIIIDNFKLHTLLPDGNKNEMVQTMLHIAQNFSTIELAKINNVVVPQNGFNDSLKLGLGNTYAVVKYFGQGHTKDNVVGYFPKENILFGGCLIKELQATKGYLGDANVGEWSSTVEKVKQQYPNVKIVIPQPKP